MTAAASPQAPTRILVVDDDRLVLATVSHGLSQAGYEVIDADNGDDAILLARQYRPALALLDIRMDGLSGFDVADYLRSHLGTPFMFLSAFADEETRAKVQALGAVAYLTKPLDNRQIVPAVGAALARVRSGAAAATPAPAPAPAPAAPAVAPSSASVSAMPAQDGAALDAADAVVGVAVGLLMHRHGWSRGAALQRLQAAAAAAGIPPVQQARQLVSAWETLHRTAPFAGG